MQGSIPAYDTLWRLCSPQFHGTAPLLCAPLTAVRFCKMSRRPPYHHWGGLWRHRSSSGVQTTYFPPIFPYRRQNALFGHPFSLFASRDATRGRIHAYVGSTESHKSVEIEKPGVKKKNEFGDPYASTAPPQGHTVLIFGVFVPRRVKKLFLHAKKKFWPRLPTSLPARSIYMR